MVGSNVAESWARINAWLRASGLPARFSPPPGVPEEAIRDAEVAMGLELPEEVRESYRTHDGSRREGVLFLFHYEFLIPMLGEGETIVSSLARKREMGAHNRSIGLKGRPDGPIRPDYWNPRRVPLTWGWEHGTPTLAVDLDPAEGGCPGQVILHTRGKTRIVSRSWGEWLATYADALEAGAYRMRVYDNWTTIHPASETDEE